MKKKELNEMHRSTTNAVEGEDDISTKEREMNSSVKGNYEYF